MPSCWHPAGQTAGPVFTGLPPGLGGTPGQGESKFTRRECFSLPLQQSREGPAVEAVRGEVQADAADRERQKRLPKGLPGNVGLIRRVRVGPSEVEKKIQCHRRKDDADAEEREGGVAKERRAQ